MMYVRRRAVRRKPEQEQLRKVCRNEPQKRQPGGLVKALRKSTFTTTTAVIEHVSNTSNKSQTSKARALHAHQTPARAMRRRGMMCRARIVRGRIA
eukprot:1013185-Prymnesium_polylepis.1